MFGVSDCIVFVPQSAHVLFSLRGSSVVCMFPCCYVMSSAKGSGFSRMRSAFEHRSNHVWGVLSPGSSSLRTGSFYKIKCALWHRLKTFMRLTGRIHHVHRTMHLTPKPSSSHAFKPTSQSLSELRSSAAMSNVGHGVCNAGASAFKGGGSPCSTVAPGRPSQRNPASPWVGWQH